MTRIVVVEDDAIISSDIAETLIRLGYDVSAVAESSEEALQAVSAHQPDVVLMDVQLRGATDGIETVASLRSTSDVPVIYLTAHTDEATLARAKETAPHGYLAKPFNDRDLRTTIEVAIRKHEFERHVADRERWFSTTLASLGDAVIATDAAERVTFMNRAAEVIVGVQGDSALGQPVGKVFRPVTAREGDIELVDGKGRRRVLDATEAPIVNDRGVSLGRVIVFRDVTERKRLDRRLERAERLASLGTMASGLAHELNNPLAVVMGNVSFALTELERSPAAEAGSDSLAECRGALHDAVSATERLGEIVETMRWFASRGSGEPKVLHVRDLVEEAVKSVQPVVTAKARLVRDYGAAPVVEVDAGQMVRALVNLFRRAADAVGGGGAGAREIRVATSTDDAGRAVIEIAHDGVVVSGSSLGRAFDPSFPASPGASATGLGLAMSHSFVLAAGGELAVEGRDGTGGVFRVSLPAAGRPRPAAPSSPVSAIPPRARILVIDDEPAVGKVIVRLLAAHHVVAETDGRAALSRIASGERFDVILCDLMMPGLTGADFHATLSSTHPRLAAKIVFLTGGTFSPEIKGFLTRVPNTVLEKPFSVDKLHAVISALLDG